MKELNRGPRNRFKLPKNVDYLLLAVYIVSSLLIVYGIITGLNK